MNLEDQRIAIAKACRWSTVPNYIDLSVMHQAEETLSYADWQVYKDWLIETTSCEESCGCADRQKHLIHATAFQRAEAFLRAIGKWVES